MTQIVRDPTTPSSSGTVLHVEDDPVIRDVVQMLLEDEGLVVSSIADGRAAVAWAELNHPILVVLDLGIPILDGVAVGAILRARYGDGLPILIVSADERADQKTRHLGPCGLVPKPFDADDLVAAVRQALDGSGHVDTTDGPPHARLG